MNSARSLLLDALAQSDVDMNNFRLLNLNTSNLSISGLPPSVTCPASNWLNSWNRISQVWGYSQPNFTDLAGTLTATQMLAITEVGTIATGTWHGTSIAAAFLPALNGLTPPTGSLSLNSQKIINLANPTNPTDAVNFQTMNAMVPGLQVHAPVAAAAPSFVSSLVGLSVPIDGYSPQAGDRILLTQQNQLARGQENGVWIAATGSWTRATDFNTSGQFTAAYVFVENGTVNGNTAMVQITPAPVNISTNDPSVPTTNPVFVTFSTNSTISAGAGLSLVGNVMSAIGTTGRITVGGPTPGINIDMNYVGQASITTLGTITTGTWNANILGPAYGGTGFNNGTSQLLLNAGSVEFLPPGYGGIVVGNIAFQTLSLPTQVTIPATGQLATLNGVETLTNKSIDASEIKTGVLTIAVGGTGAATAMLALLNLLPSITGQAGKSLKTDGITVFWG